MKPMQYAEIPALGLPCKYNVSLST